ncbi:MAG: glycosyltransferase family 4 protein [Erysipelotrichales bacterium]|nr:glycosyltransferase family 4 protein [Tissierellia bacterium]MEA4820943.1 glycosyltransferase family 4 protein [Erysipelotrichales bacterium]
MNIAVLTSGILPVPASQGGAVENLIDFYLEFNELNKLHNIVVFSVINHKYTNTIDADKTQTKYVIFRADKLLYRIKRKIFGFFHRNSLYYHHHIEYYLFRALKLIKKKNFDLIILENRPGYAEKVAKLFPETPIVLHLHNDFLSKETKKSSILKARLSSVITVSDYIKRRTDAILPAKPSYTCYNGIDLSRFQGNGKRFETRNQLKINEDEFVVVFSGRLIPEKGVKELIMAMHQLNNSSVKLLIIGGSFFGDNAEITSYIKDLYRIAFDFRDRVIFTGYKSYDEIPEMLKCADIAVVPSLWEEPFSLSCLEAMACGLPLIITNSGGMPEVVDENCAIILEKEADFSKEIADSVLSLLQNPEKRKRMALAAVERSKLFSKEQFASHFFSLLNS